MYDVRCEMYDEQNTYEIKTIVLIGIMSINQASYIKHRTAQTLHIKSYFLALEK